MYKKAGAAVPLRGVGTMGLEKINTFQRLVCEWCRHRTKDEAGVQDNRSFRNRDIENADVKNKTQ